MVTIPELKRLLAQVGTKLSKAGVTDNKTWTKEIKSALVAFGHKSEQWVFAAGVRGADGREWIYDVSFIELEDVGQPSPYLAKLTLAVESEWSTSESEIVYDFQKLLCSKAQRKLFIYQGEANLLKFFKGNIARWDDPKGTYLIARYDNEEEAFKYTVI